MRIATLFTGLVLLAVTGCGGGGGGSSPSTTPPTVSAPSNLAYTVPTAAYTQGTAITPNSPSNSGGTPSSYSVAPTLPTGLAFNISTGVISGTPTVVAPTSSYLVTASNSGGSTSISLSITVSAALGALSYSTSTAVYTLGAAITPNIPTLSSGTATGYSISPTLPAGLSLNSSTGVISGTPTVVTSAANYLVTASTGGGNATTTVNIAVNDATLGNLTYATNPAVYSKGTAIAANSPSLSGGIATGYSVTPSLPTGLIFNATTGVITGTPSGVASTASYVVKASNGSGSSTVSLSITVNDIAPANLSYNIGNSFTVGTAITPGQPSSTGGTIVSYSVSPALPAGLTLNTSTGVIGGTPTTVTSQAYYTITATNSGGHTSVTNGMTVTGTVVLAPSNLSYTIQADVEADPGNYTLTPVSLFAWVGVPIIPKVPNFTGVSTPYNQGSNAVTGGVPTSYSVSPSLPAGLSLNTSTGVISGTASVQTPKATYTITASNAGGSTTVDMPITVNAALPAMIAVPDVNFQNALIAQGIPITNGQVNVSDAAAVTKIQITTRLNIQSIAGIEAFVNLTYLEVDHNPITSPNLANNGNLTWFEIWDDLSLTSIDVSPLVNAQLICLSLTGLTNADFSQNISVVELDLQNDSDDPNTTWSVSQGLTSLDVSHNTNLWRLYCGFNRIPSLDFTHNPQLSEVWAENNELVSLDFTHNPQMYVMVLYNNNLTYLNIKGCGVPRTCTTFYPTANPPISAGLSNKNQNLLQIWVDNVAAIQAWAAQYPVWYSQGPQTTYVQ